jgi:cytosine/adenosine deaminase-related metal-dependent hydrolase
MDACMHDSMMVSSFHPTHRTPHSHSVVDRTQHRESYDLTLLWMWESSSAVARVYHSHRGVQLAAVQGAARKQGGRVLFWKSSLDHGRWGPHPSHTKGQGRVGGCARGGREVDVLSRHDRLQQKGLGVRMACQATRTEMQLCDKLRARINAISYAEDG